eukprot:364818-Chlamydomonas_euryale.AAC.6
MAGERPDACDQERASVAEHAGKKTGNDACAGTGGLQSQRHARVVRCTPGRGRARDPGAASNTHSVFLGIGSGHAAPTGPQTHGRITIRVDEIIGTTCFADRKLVGMRYGFGFACGRADKKISGGPPPTAAPWAIQPSIVSGLQQPRSQSPSIAGGALSGIPAFAAQGHVGLQVNRPSRTRFVANCNPRLRVNLPAAAPTCLRASQPCPWLIRQEGSCGVLARAKPTTRNPGRQIAPRAAARRPIIRGGSPSASPTPLRASTTRSRCSFLRVLSGAAGLRRQPQPSQSLLLLGPQPASRQVGLSIKCFCAWFYLSIPVSPRISVHVTAARFDGFLYKNAEAMNRVTTSYNRRPGRHASITYTPVQKG